MPQMQLPIFPEGFTAITNSIGFQNRDGKVAYFYGHLPVFQHDTGDVQSFRLFTSQLIVQGTDRDRESFRGSADDGEAVVGRYFARKEARGSSPSARAGRRRY